MAITDCAKHQETRNNLETRKWECGNFVNLFLVFGCMVQSEVKKIILLNMVYAR